MIEFLLSSNHITLFVRCLLISNMTKAKRYLMFNITSSYYDMSRRLRITKLSKFIKYDVLD